MIGRLCGGEREQVFPHGVTMPTGSVGIALVGVAGGPWLWPALIWAVPRGDGICGHWWAGSWCGQIPKISFPHLSVKPDVDVYCC